MNNIFDMSRSDLIKLKRFFKNSPNDFKRATAGVLNSLAFMTRNYDIQNITSTMTVRSPGFVKNSLRYQKTKITSIDRQMSIAYSTGLGKTTGWKEQEYGSRTKLNRTITKSARSGSWKNKVKSKARLKSSNKFYKPENFPGKTYKQRFMFMMRIIARKGTQQFMLSEKVPTARGALSRGLYEVSGHGIKKLQNFDKVTQPKHNAWRTRSIQQLRTRNNMRTIWQQQISRIVKRYR